VDSEVGNLTQALEQARAAGLVPDDLGTLRTRSCPHTAILHTEGEFSNEFVTSLVYHFIQLSHNVIVYTTPEDDDDKTGYPLSFQGRYGVRHRESFYNEFYQYDVIVMAQLSAHGCYRVEGTMAGLLTLNLPQRVLAMVSDPDLLATDAVVALLEDTYDKIQLLTTSPHVNAYAEDILEGEGLNKVVAVDWFLPIFPVAFPEYSRTAQTPPSAKIVDENLPQSRDIVAWGHVARHSFFHGARTDDSGASALPRQQRSFCVLDALESDQHATKDFQRQVSSLIADISFRRSQLLAANFSMVLLGEAEAGYVRTGLRRWGAAAAWLKTHIRHQRKLEEEGLIINLKGIQHSLKQHEYYTSLRSCMAIVPVPHSSDPLDYVRRGAGASAATVSLISGTPLILTPSLLAAYSFLDASAVFLVPEGTGRLAAMEAVMAAPLEVVRAKGAALGRLRDLAYDRNIVMLQRSLGKNLLAV